VLAVGGEMVEFRRDRLLIDGEAASYQTLDPGRFAHLRVANSMGTRFLVEHLHGGSWAISCHRETSSVSDLGPITVPDGHFFLVGDNRASSWDSRYPEFGCVPRSRILGRVIGDGHPIPEPLAG
jgi:signal peptidase I